MVPGHEQMASKSEKQMLEQKYFLQGDRNKKLGELLVFLGDIGLIVWYFIYFQDHLEEVHSHFKNTI